MKSNERGLKIVIAVALILVAVLLFCACNDLTINEAYPVSDTGDTETAVLSDGESDAVAAQDTSEDQNAAQSDQSNDTSQNVTNDGGSSDISDQTEGNGSDVTGANEQGETSDGTQEDGEEDASEVRDGYSRITSVSGGGDRSIFVFDQNLGIGRISEDGYLFTEIFIEKSIGIWQKGSCYYFYFETLQGFRQVVFREEVLAVQIDLTEEELSLLLPKEPLEQGVDAEDEEDAGGTSEEETTEEDSSEKENGDAIAENEQKGDTIGSDEDNDENDGSEEENGENEESEQNSADFSIFDCSVCGALLFDAGTHAKDCIYYGEIPASSAAHDFLDGLSGMRESLAVTCLDEGCENYAFVLNYLTAEDLQEVATLLLSCEKKINVAELADGKKEYRVGQKIGEMQFTFYALVENDSEDYKVTFHVSGALPEEYED